MDEDVQQILVEGLLPSHLKLLAVEKLLRWFCSCKSSTFASGMSVVLITSLQICFPGLSLVLYPRESIEGHSLGGGVTRLPTWSCMPPPPPMKLV